jgi:Cytosol aminopeptidase family, N-terminal domain
MLLSIETASRATLDTAAVDAVLCGYFADERPATGLFGLLDYERCGALSRLRIRGFARGVEGELLMYALRLGIPATRLLAIGLGCRAAFDTSRAEVALNALLRAAEEVHVRRILLEVPGRPSAVDAEPALDVALAALENRMFARVLVVDGPQQMVGLRSRLQERGRKFQERGIEE